jgi:hypothetical protein
MSTDSFVQRVQALRDSWAERRLVQRLAGAHDFDSQYRLLTTLHTWVGEAARDISAVYGSAMSVSVSPVPDALSRTPAFSIVIGGAYTVTFALTERRRMGGPRWFVTVLIGSAGPGGAVAAAGPERRNGQWTRGRLEDVLLSVLGAYERATSSESPLPGESPLTARGA